MSTMRGLGRLIVRGQFLSNPIYPNYTSTRIREGSYAFSRIFNSYHVFNFSAYTECKHYHAEAEIKGGSDDLKYKRCITKGDTISLNDLLFTNNRDYLIKNNNQQVKVEQLEGKVIGIYFVPLYEGCEAFPPYSKWTTALLKDVYDDLHPDNNFEVVLVSCDDLHTDCVAEISVDRSLQSDSQKHFDDLFSCMPWTAIPFSDVTSRKHIQRKFGVRDIICSPIMYIIDRTGMVLQCDSWDILEYYGALGYPFSDKRLKILRTEDYEATQQPSLRTLLGSPQRNYVISNKGDKVPIHTFEDKVVALYFYHPDEFPDLITDELKLAYEEFAKIKKIFEVVLIYIRESRHPYEWKSEEMFWEKFKTMPWLALPFKDMGYKKLKRVFEYQCDDVLMPLVIFGPRADYIEPFGSSMLLEYKIQGFPFTRKKAAELENEKVKVLKLEMLWDPNTVFRRNDGSQVPFSQLSGKRVMLVLETFNDLHTISSTEMKLYTKFLTELKERYLQKKGTDDEFEVIRILINNTESSVTKYLVGDMPCLVSSGSELIHDLDSPYFWYGLSTEYLFLFHFPVFAFDLDGKLVRKTIYPTFEASEFPFYSGGLEEETLSQLITCFSWNYSLNFRYKGRIWRFYTGK